MDETKATKPPRAEGRVKTDALMRALFKTSSFERFVNKNGDALEMEPFHEYISRLAEERGEVRANVIRRADIDVSFGHQLFRGTRNPSRDKVIQLAFGLRCSVDEAQQMLKHARLSPLYPKLKRDAALLYCLHNGLELVDTQLMLEKLGLTPLGGTEEKA